MTGRKLAAQIDRSHTAVGLVLDDLAEQGLVLRQPAGRSVLHRLNPEHVLFEAVTALARAKTELFERIIALVADWEPAAVSVTAYGSVIAGHERRGSTQSDIDLIVVLPLTARGREQDSRWTEQLGDLAGAVERWTGNPAEILDYTIDELRTLGHESASYVQDLMRGRHLHGERLRSLLTTGGST